MCVSQCYPVWKWYLVNLSQTKELWHYSVLVLPPPHPRDLLERQRLDRNVFTLGHLPTILMLLRHRRLRWFAHAYLSDEKWPHTNKFSYEISHLEKKTCWHASFSPALWTDIRADMRRSKNTHSSAKYDRHYGGLDCHINFNLSSIWYLTSKLLICNGNCGSHVFKMDADYGRCNSPTYLKTFLLNPWPRKPTHWHWNHDCMSLNFRDIQICMCGGHVFQDGPRIW